MAYFYSCTEAPHRSQLIYLPQEKCCFTASEVRVRGSVELPGITLEASSSPRGYSEKDLRRLYLSLCSSPGPSLLDLQDPARSRERGHTVLSVSGGHSFREGDSPLRDPASSFLSPGLVCLARSLSGMELELGL